MFRLAISPYVGYLVICEQFSWALGLVFLAALTDSVKISICFNNVYKIVDVYKIADVYKVFDDYKVFEMCMYNSNSYY